MNFYQSCSCDRITQTCLRKRDERNFSVCLLTSINYPRVGWISKDFNFFINYLWFHSNWKQLPIVALIIFILYCDKFLYCYRKIVTCAIVRVIFRWCQNEWEEEKFCRVVSLQGLGTFKHKKILNLKIFYKNFHPSFNRHRNKFFSAFPSYSICSYFKAPNTEIKVLILFIFLLVWLYQVELTALWW